MLSMQQTNIKTTADSEMAALVQQLKEMQQNLNNTNTKVSQIENAIQCMYCKQETCRFSDSRLWSCSGLLALCFPVENYSMPNLSQDGYKNNSNISLLGMSKKNFFEKDTITPTMLSVLIQENSRTPTMLSIMILDNNKNVNGELHVITNHNSTGSNFA